MFAEMESALVVKRGKCLYDNVKEYEIRIIQWHTLYGSGDYEDSEDIREDREVECYYIFYEDLIKKGKFHGGNGGFLSIKEAITFVESSCEIKWLED